MENTATSAALECSQMECEATEEHRWLQELEGTWTVQGEMQMDGQPPTQFAGRETVRKVGELWIVAEGEGEMPDGSPAAMVTTLGYDPARECFVGTFIGSMMANLWIYEGQLDASRRILTLDTEAPSVMSEGELTRFQDIFEIVGPNRRKLTSQLLGEDGEWKVFMRSTYTRT